MKRYPLNIKNYANNAAKKFSIARLVIYSLISLVLSILLIISSINKGYGGFAIVFVSIAFVMIFGYFILNVIALIIKIRKN